MEEQASGTAENRKKLMNAIASRIEGPAIFEDEVQQNRSDVQQSPGDVPVSRTGVSHVREHTARAADPDPRSRVRWERKMVIRQVQRGTNPYSREPRAERIARTERELTSRSTWLPTSTKKLVHLARQIQGKTVADALVQMRFSKKKMAQEVRFQLELARDRAIVERGMGLGAAAAAKNAAGGEVRASGDSKTMEIQTKDGKWVKIDDPTRMYVAEAWVNRGTPRHKYAEYRARGRMNLKVQPKTSEFSPILSRRLSSPFLTRILQASRSSSKKKRHGSARRPSARPRSSATDPGSTSPTAPSPLNGSGTRGRRLSGRWLGVVHRVLWVGAAEKVTAQGLSHVMAHPTACINNGAARVKNLSLQLTFAAIARNVQIEGVFQPATGRLPWH